MGRVYEGTRTGIGPSHPVARFTGAELPLVKDTWLVGVKTAERAGKEFTNEKGEKRGSKVFEFQLFDMHPGLRIQKKNGKIYEDTDVKVGDTVVVFGNSQLDDKLGQVPAQQKIKITYNGKKLNPNSGRWFNDFTVADAE